MPRSPGLDDIDEWPSESGEFSIEGEGSFAENSGVILRHAAAFMDVGYADPPPIAEQLQFYLDAGYDLAEAVGQLDLVTETVPHWSLEKNVSISTVGTTVYRRAVVVGKDTIRRIELAEFDPSRYRGAFPLFHLEREFQLESGGAVVFF